MNKKVMLLIPILIGVMFVLPLLSAAVAVVAPATGANLSGSFLVNCSYINGTDLTSPNAASTSFYFVNGTGSENLFLTRTGFTVTSTNVYATLTTADAVGEGAGAVKCSLGNATSPRFANASSGALTIDDVAPVIVLSLETENLATRDSILIKWTVTGASTVNTTITSPDAGRCPTKTYTDVNAQYAIADDATACSGIYTVRVTAVDATGNVATAVKTFKAGTSGLSKTGSNTLGGDTTSSFSQGQEINSVGSANLPLGQTGTNIAILVILAGGLYLFFKKK